MVKTVVANPPLGIYKNPDISIGQAFYMTQLDVYTRARRDLLGEDISFPTYAFNVFGRRGDLQEDPVRFAREYRERPSLRERLDLCSAETLSDDEESLVVGIQSDFIRLFERGYLLKNGSGEFFLDVQKIKGKISLNSLLEGVSMSGRTSQAIQRYWNENMNSPHQVTKPTRFSVTNPLGGQNIGPLFGLANLWDHKYPNANVVMAGSERNLTNYVFLRMLTQMVLRGTPGVSQIFIYPQLRFAEGAEEWDLKKMLAEDYGSDFLRYGLCTPSTTGDGSSRIDLTKIKEGRKFVYCLGNLGKILNYQKDSESYLDVLDEVLSFEISASLPKLNRSAKDISNRARIAKLSGSFEQQRRGLEEEYSKIVRTASIITPKICNKVMNRKNG